MIETPADYRSFVFLSNKTAGLFAPLGFPGFCFYLKKEHKKTIFNSSFTQSAQP